MDDGQPVRVLNNLEREAGALGRSERRLEAAHELAQIGLTLARRLVDDDGQAAEIALAYSRIARAVRMSLALEAMIEGDVQVRHERVRREKRSQDTMDRIDRVCENQETLRSVVREAIEADGAERSERERLYGALDEVLADEHDWEAIEDLSLAEAVEY